MESVNLVLTCWGPYKSFSLQASNKYGLYQNDVIDGDFPHSFNCMAVKFLPSTFIYDFERLCFTHLRSIGCKSHLTHTNWKTEQKKKKLRKQRTRAALGIFWNYWRVKFRNYSAKKKYKREIGKMIIWTNIWQRYGVEKRSRGWTFDPGLKSEAVSGRGKWSIAYYSSLLIVTTGYHFIAHNGPIFMAYQW